MRSLPSLTFLACMFLLALGSCTSLPPDIPVPETTVEPAFAEAASPSPQADDSAVGSLSLPLVSAPPSPTPIPSDTPLPPTATPSPTPEPAVRFAVIGDYGLAGTAEADVAALVTGWEPDLIITLGDNNYPDGEPETIDENIGQYFHDYIFPYTGSFGPAADQNRFFPTLGNHDWNTTGAAPYLEYFSLPNNERYYDFTWGPVHFFAIDSDSREPDGVGMSSTQAEWLQANLAESNAVWKIVYAHHPPYSSGYHGPVDWMDWPFQEWGATAYLAGHDHTYERLAVNGFPYFVNGLGGGAIYPFISVLPESQVRFNGDYGAMLVEATSSQITFEFITRQAEVIDQFQILAAP